MGRGMIETVMGAVVLGCAALFIFFAYDLANVKAEAGYQVTATFYKIGGLQSGSDVRMSGIKIGTVKSGRLDPETYDAIVDLHINEGVELPADTVAVIADSGLIGGKYVRLEPGKSTDRITAGGTITQTKDFRSLEDQVGEIIFLATGGNGQN
ncbi:MAG: outer membrane lipid asymmetry maintenance protein MlaD [Magnetovibrionaceae bacterium]